MDKWSLYQGAEGDCSIYLCKEGFKPRAYSLPREIALKISKDMEEEIEELPF